MKFNEDILKELNLEPVAEKEPVNVMQISEMLQFIKECAERMIRKSQLYDKTENADIQMDCIDIVTAKLNDFTQVFKDLVIFMRKEEGIVKNAVSLRYCISSFDTFEFRQTKAEKTFLQELLIRNEITHDYFNREMHQQKLIWIMQHCMVGALDVYNHINGYCTEKKFLNKYTDKNP
ncbi:MAG: hypothetical protein LBS02_21600 [Hungatella sp.]|jgi:hypothetical protein|nr:hypothetical protein [Hungatella sp.]